MRSLILASSLAMSAVSSSMAQSIVGSWVIRNAGESKSTAVLTFLANGTYTMAEDGNRTLDPNGKDGMERGTYRWNSTTKAITIKTLVDTTREWGLSHSSLESIAVTASKMTIKATDGSFTLNRVGGKSTGLTGAWYLRNPEGGYAVVTFLSDGTYFMVQDGKAQGGGKTGMERGTFQWNPLTLAFTRKVRVDTNGTWGFSDPGKIFMSVSGNKLKITDQGGEEFTLSRVTATK